MEGVGGRKGKGGGSQVIYFNVNFLIKNRGEMKIPYRNPLT